MTLSSDKEGRAAADSWKRDKELEHYKADLAHISDLFRATTAFEHAALKPLFFLNGGALIAVVAFLGAISKGDRNVPASMLDLRELKLAIGAWSVGLIFAALTAGLGYRSQLAFYKAHNRRLDMFKAEEGGDIAKAEQESRLLETFDSQGQNCRKRAEICGWVSILAFVAGSGLAVFAII